MRNNALYRKYIQTKEWKAIADECKNLAGNKCSICGSTDNLQAHHKTYKNLGNESQDDLECLCRSCHSRKHRHMQRPVNGYKGVYMKTLENIVDLSKPAQRLFFSIVNNVDEYNRIMVPWNKLLDTTKSQISKSKKELEEAMFISRIGKIYVLNPFIVLPKYRSSQPEKQNEMQVIWKRYVEDMNSWYDGVDEDVEEIFGCIKQNTK